MDIIDLEPYISEHPFFKGLGEEHLKLLVGCAMNVRFNQHDVIFRQNEEANHFFLIRHGKVSVEIPSITREPVVVETIHEGDVLGWSWLFPPYRWHFDARALDLTRAIALDGKCLRKKCEQDTKLGYELMRRFSCVMMERLQSARIQLMDLYGSPDPPESPR